MSYSAEECARSRDRFLACMEYGSADRVPNHELGVWGQTRQRWVEEGMPAHTLRFDWFVGEPFLGLDYREFVSVNYGMMPPFEEKVLERTERYEIIQHADGRVTKALIEGMVGGTRASMDQYLAFPIQNRQDFQALKRRYVAQLPARYPPCWEAHIEGWNIRQHVLVLGRNCEIAGFYWRAREWLGTENLSYAWYDQPTLMHEMMEFFADFVMEVSRPLVERVSFDYVTLNEDLAMKTGPLLSPQTFRTFIFPHLRRLVEFFKAHGVRYVALDTDGNCEVLIPLMMDAGVDVLWPLERAAGMDPVSLRSKFGRGLRLWGGVDKRELARDRASIRRHLAGLAPLVGEGGFIPTVDHTVPPDVSWDNFRYYMDLKRRLLEGKAIAQ